MLVAYGAADRNRTGDLLITNQLLYRLSYSSEGTQIYPRPSNASTGVRTRQAHRTGAAIAGKGLQGMHEGQADRLLTDIARRNTSGPIQNPRRSHAASSAVHKLLFLRFLPLLAAGRAGTASKDVYVQILYCIAPNLDLKIRFPPPWVLYLLQDLVDPERVRPGICSADLRTTFASSAPRTIRGWLACTPGPAPLPVADIVFATDRSAQ